MHIATILKIFIMGIVGKIKDIYNGRKNYCSEFHENHLCSSGKIGTIPINSLKIRERIHKRLEINILVDRTESYEFLCANHYKIVQEAYREARRPYMKRFRLPDR